MFGQEVQCFRGPLQILDGRPVFVAGALLGFEIVLDVDEQAGLPGALLRLAGGPGPSSDPGGQGLLGVVGAQGFQSGEPLLARSPGGYVLAPFQLIPFPLEAAEQVLQVGAAGQEPVGFWKLFFVGIGQGIMMWAGALPCVLLVVLLNRSYIISVIITFFYTAVNYIFGTNDYFIMQPFGFNAGTLLPGPLTFRWFFQYLDTSSSSAQMTELMERISPYFVTTPQAFLVVILESAVFLTLIALVYKRQSC